MAESSQLPVINQLGESHRRLGALLDQIGPQGLSGPSACSDWSIGRVVAHIGSGAEIASGALKAGLAGSSEALADDVMQKVWAEYDALGDEPASARGQVANGALVEAFEALSETELADVRVPFFIGPVPVATFGGFRLSEHAVHTWDVEVAADPAAELDPTSATIIFDNVVKALIGHLARPLESGPVSVDVQLSDVGRNLRLEVGESVSFDDVESGGNADGSLVIPTAAFVRLVYGRLGPEQTPDSVEATGSVSLDQLRQIFPGF